MVSVVFNCIASGRSQETDAAKFTPEGTHVALDRPRLEVIVQSLNRAWRYWLLTSSSDGIEVAAPGRSTLMPAAAHP